MGKVLCLVWLVALAVTAWADGVTYSLHPVELSPPALVYPRVPWTAQPPPGSGPMPAFRQGGARFAQFQLGDNPPLLVAFAPYRTEAGESTYVAYLDLKGTHALADATPQVFTRQKIGGAEYLVSPRITVPVTYRFADGTQATHDLTFALAARSIPPPPAPPKVAPPGKAEPTVRKQAATTVRVTRAPVRLLTVTSAYYLTMMVVYQAWGGTVNLGGKDVEVELRDTDGDGKIKAGTLRSPGDTLILRLGSPETYQRPAVAGMLTRYVGLNDKFYQFDVRPDGSQVTVTPLTDDVGRVQLRVMDGTGAPAALRYFGFSSDDLQSQHPLKLPMLDAPILREGVSLPAGKYLLSCQLQLKSPRGNALAILSSAEPTIVVKPGETTKVTCGGKIKLEIAVTQSPGSLRINVKPLTVEGGYSFQTAMLTPLALGGGRRTAPYVPGKVKVFDPAGRMVGMASAQYG